jgi:hypothetical protein
MTNWLQTKIASAIRRLRSRAGKTTRRRSVAARLRGAAGEGSNFRKFRTFRKFRMQTALERR